MAEVVFDHVTRIYPGNDKPSVDDLNLDIKDGEFLVLVGPSGCGKSTTLRMLAGLEEVNKGRILIGGKDVTTTRLRISSFGVPAIFRAKPMLSATVMCGYRA